MSKNLNVIPIDIKRECCRLKNEGCKTKDIYNDFFKKQFDKPQNYESFKCSLRRWNKKIYPKDSTLFDGTYSSFIAHDATVQVSSDGTITQAWIKQKKEDVDVYEFLEAIKDEIQVYDFKKQEHNEADRMLEIPLFDMHWGIAFIDHYKYYLDNVLDLIKSKKWDKISIVFGQDFFHNDSIVKGRTSKGTHIEKVDTRKAVKQGEVFMFAIIDAALENANEVEILYSPGNHDKSISWMFMQILLVRYGESIVDDSDLNRKVITYGSNSIMITHGDSKNATLQNLSQIFPISFPKEFTEATVREVHSGHLHRESSGDFYGVMVRRLSSANITDSWTDANDFVGAHKRFMLFEWDLKSLKSIHYIQ